MEDFLFLQKAFKGNPALREFVFWNYNTKYLRILELLFGELYRNSCEGIEIKVSETSPDLIRFQSLVSELEIARYFVRRNTKVKLLSDNDFQSRKPPDLYAHHNSTGYFVEVKNIQEDELDYILGLEIVKILNSRGLSLIVNVDSSAHMSTPTYFYDERGKKEEYLKSALDEFTIKLNSMKHLPTIIETTYVDVELQGTKKGKSYLGISSMKEAIREPPDYKERIRYDVLQKAEKRSHWTSDELDKFYVVAIDDDSSFFYIDRYNVEFFGHATTYLGEVPEVRLDSEIENAVKNDWKEYLTKMCILQNNKTIIPEDKRGLFFTEQVTKNVSAILVKHRENFCILANPLADSRINDPNILREFEDVFIGWE